MLIVKVKGKNGIERALKEYTKNSVEKREKKKKAIYVNKKKNGL